MCPSQTKVKFSIQIIVSKASRRKLQNVSLQGCFFLCFWQNVYQYTLVPQTFAYHEKFLVTHLHSFVIHFAKHTILNIWQCSEYFSVSTTAQSFVLWPYAMYCIRHIQNPGIFSTLFLQLYVDIFNHIQHYILTHTETFLRHIQAYSGIFSTLCNTCIFKTFPYSGNIPYVHIYGQKMLSWKVFFVENKMECNIAVQRDDKS